MKKILATFICILLMFVLPVVAFAEDEIPTDPVVTEEPAEIETDVVEEDDPNDLTVDKIVGYVKDNIEVLTLLVTYFLSAIYKSTYNNKLNKNLITLNNNSVEASEKSLSEMATMSGVVSAYQEAITKLLEEVQRNDAERTELESSLKEVTKYLKATRLANKELGNEIAQLLLLANIPNSVKDELYARHIAAMNAIAEAEGTTSEEVKENEDEAES